jgi:hypothetical protein
MVYGVWLESLDAKHLENLARHRKVKIGRTIRCTKLWGSEYQDQIVRTVNNLITTLCLGSRPAGAK